MFKNLKLYFIVLFLFSFFCVQSAYSQECQVAFKPQARFSEWMSPNIISNSEWVSYEALKQFANNSSTVDAPREYRRVLAEEVLGRKLTDQQTDAVERAHLVGLGEVGKDGINPARIGNYTEAHLREKAKILQQAGFSKLERETLIKKGVVGLLALGEAVGLAFQMGGMILGIGITGAVALSVPVYATIFGSRFIGRMISAAKLKPQIEPMIGRKLTSEQTNMLAIRLRPKRSYYEHTYYYIRDYRDRAKAVAQQRRKEKMDYDYPWRSEMEKRGIRQEQQARNRQWLAEVGFSQAEIRLEPYFDDVEEVIWFKRNLSRKGTNISAGDIQRLHLYESGHRSFVAELLNAGFSKDEIAKLFRAKVL